MELHAKTDLFFEVVRGTLVFKSEVYFGQNVSTIDLSNVVPDIKVVEAYVWPYLLLYTWIRNRSLFSLNIRKDAFVRS